MDNTLIARSITAFFVALVASTLATPLVIRLATKYHLVDDPKKRKHPAHTHTGIIPRAGGLALFLGIILPILFLLPLAPLIRGIFLSSILLVVTGLCDDYRDVNPFIRLSVNALATMIVIASGVTIPFITNPFSGGVVHLTTWIIHLGPIDVSVWSNLAAFIWIMWTLNIIGWSSGVDGQMPGFVAISALVIGFLSFRYSFTDPSQSIVTLLAFIVAGSFLGFLPWNFYPQKIMPGYGGKTLAGFFLGILAILSYAKLGTALLVLGIPMIDALYTLLRRISSKKSPVRADRGHLHHKLLALGWGRRKIALFYWGVSAILGAIALTVKSQHKVFALLLVTVIIGGFILWVNFFSQFSKPQDQDSG